MTAVLSATDIVRAVRAGDCDSDLTGLQEALTERRSIVSQRQFSRLKVGDRIRIVAPNCNPRYLDGSYGHIRKVNISRVVVDLEIKRGNRFDHGVTLKADQVELAPQK